MPGAGAGVHHAGDRVVPGVLLSGGARRLGVVGGGVLDHPVAGMAASHPRGLHAPVGGEIGRAEAHALHPRAGRGDLLEVGHALGRLEDRVHEQRALEPRLGLELRQQAVDVVDVPRSLDLGHHHDVEAVADLGHDLGQVVQDPGAFEGVDTSPQRGLAEIHLPAHPDQSLPRGLLAVHRHGVLQVAEQDVHLAWRSSGAFATIFSFEKSRKWIIREGLKGISGRGSGAPMASGLRKSLGLRISPRTLAPGPCRLCGPGRACSFSARERGDATAVPRPLRRLRRIRVGAAEADRPTGRHDRARGRDHERGQPREPAGAGGGAEPGGEPARQVVRGAFSPSGAPLGRRARGPGFHLHPRQRHQGCAPGRPPGAAAGHTPRVDEARPRLRGAADPRPRGPLRPHHLREPGDGGPPRAAGARPGGGGLPRS